MDGITKSPGFSFKICYRLEPTPSPAPFLFCLFLTKKWAKVIFHVLSTLMRCLPQSQSNGAQSITNWNSKHWAHPHKPFLSISWFSWTFHSSNRKITQNIPGKTKDQRKKGKRNMSGSLTSHISHLSWIFCIAKNVYLKRQKIGNGILPQPCLNECLFCIDVFGSSPTHLLLSSI